MERKLAWAITFAFGVIGGVALSTGWQTATAIGPERVYNTPGSVAIVGGARLIGVGPGHVPPRAGHWIVSASGLLTWMADDPAAPTGGTSPDAAWYAEREKELADLQKEIECQFNSCDP